jgi:thiamine-monophosphate kinase
MSTANRREAAERESAMNAPVSEVGEFELIRRYFQQRQAQRDAPQDARGGVVLGIGDDGALLRLPEGTDLVAAVDTLVAGRHFPPTTAAHSIGYRALAVNLSDLAAMGATPAWATLALTMPSAQAQWLEDFSAGFFDIARQHGVILVGGDTTRGPLTVSVQILGSVPRGAALRRSGAKAGDLLAVTGTLGDAGAGLKFATAAPGAADRGGVDRSGAQAGAVEALIRRFDYPTPRVGLGLAARGVASAAMDISDGLAGDLPKLAAASGLHAHVYVERLPLSAELRATVSAAQAREWALVAGDDYELLLAASPANYPKLEAAAQQLNLTLTIIGELSSGSGVSWSADGVDYTPAESGFEHFGQASTQITV